MSAEYKNYDGFIISFNALANCFLESLNYSFLLFNEWYGQFDITNCLMQLRYSYCSYSRTVWQGENFANSVNDRMNKVSSNCLVSASSVYYTVQ